MITLIQKQKKQIRTIIKGFTMSIIIRQATLQDAPSILPLMVQLGYPTTSEKLIERMNFYLISPDYEVFVAQQENNIVGLVTLTFFQHFVGDKKACRITALVVDEKYRKHGIGRLLMTEVENCAKNFGYSIIELTSGLRRAKDGSHEFYKKLGYQNEGFMAKLYLRKELS